MRRAMTSLPTPVSPVIRTLASDRAAQLTSASSAFITLLTAMNCGSLDGDGRGTGEVLSNGCGYKVGAGVDFCPEFRILREPDARVNVEASKELDASLRLAAFGRSVRRLSVHRHTVFIVSQKSAFRKT